MPLFSTKKQKSIRVKPTHVVQPGDDLGPWPRVGPDVAVKVGVHALADVRGHQGGAQADGHDRGDWEREKEFLIIMMWERGMRVTFDKSGSKCE